MIFSELLRSGPWIWEKMKYSLKRITYIKISKFSIFFISFLFHLFTFKLKNINWNLRAPVAQASKQEVRSLNRYQWKFSNCKYFNRGFGSSEPTLNCRSHHKRSVTSRKEAPCRGKNYLGVFGWFWEICLYWFRKTLQTRKREGV